MFAVRWPRGRFGDDRDRAPSRLNYHFQPSVLADVPSLAEIVRWLRFPPFKVRNALGDCLDQ